ncbi:hypothetical protein [Nocardia fusca]|uniref:hypothetical protein n=1 Tax=Nocardia fusca TaxID=941183 RepID=UPI0007A735B4|nr:hypothetical protein [Nocardia fusca]
MIESSAAGLGGIGFVLTAVVVNLVYVRARLPLPMSGQGMDEVVDALAAVGDALKRPSVLAPLTWLCTTLFAAGMASAMWESPAAPTMWLLLGFGGVLMQNVAFSCVEALRFGLAATARDHASTSGLWALHNVLFGFNQVFLAIALLGFGLAAAETGFLPPWQQWLGFAAATLLFLASSASSHNAEGTSRLALIGLVGWLGWIAWIVAASITLLAR